MLLLNGIHLNTRTAPVFHTCTDYFLHIIATQWVRQIRQLDLQQCSLYGVSIEQIIIMCTGQLADDLSLIHI